MGAQHEQVSSYLNNETAFLISAGYAFELLDKSKYHRRFSLNDYFPVCVLPPLLKKQMQFWVSKEHTPTALMSWARVTSTVEHDILRTGRDLKSHEWNCGDQLFIVDWITPYRNLRVIRHDVVTKMFPDETAHSIHRAPDGSIQRINKFRGANVSLSDVQ